MVVYRMHQYIAPVKHHHLYHPLHPASHLHTHLTSHAQVTCMCFLPMDQGFWLVAFLCLARTHMHQKWYVCV